MERSESRAIVADHHPLCRGGLASLVGDRMRFSFVSQAADFPHLLSAIARYRDVGLVTVSGSLPEMHGATGLGRIRREFPSIRLVVVAESRERDRVLEALCAGVHGYVVKDTPPDEIVRALELVMMGHVYVPSLVSDVNVAQRATALASNEPTLTDRQLEVLRLVAAGRSNKEIARSLGIAEGTVKVHITAAFRALGVHNRVSAAAALQLRPKNDNPQPATAVSDGFLPQRTPALAELPLWG